MVILLIEVAIMSRLIAKFNSYYAEKPGGFYTLCSVRAGSGLTIDLYSLDHDDHQRGKPPRPDQAFHADKVYTCREARLSKAY